LNTLEAYTTNAQRRYKENRPAKWWVVIELFMMGCITGYFVPIWCGMIVNPHTRTRIDTLFEAKFPNGLDSMLTKETLLVSYDYSE